MIDLSSLTRLQKMELLAYLIDDLNQTALPFEDNNVIVAQFVTLTCKFCGDEFHGKSDDLHCQKPGCKQAWFEREIQSKLDIARLKSKNRHDL